MLRKLALAAAIGVPALAAASSLALAENPYVAYGPPVYYDDYGDPVIVAADEPVVIIDEDDDDAVRLTCGQARDAVEDLGFDQVVRDDCDGNVYTFVGRRDGDVYTVKVDAITGAVIAG
jgi:hypothetical protein